MNEDVARLLEFLERFDGLITFLFERITEITPQYLHQSLGDIQEPSRAHSRVLHAAVAGAANSDRDMAYLTSHGLTRPELTVKLAGFNNAAENLEATKDSVADDDGRPRWLRFGKSALKWAGIILGSLGGLFPAAGALNEIRQVLERAIEDAENPQRGPIFRTIFERPYVPPFRQHEVEEEGA